MNDDFDCPRIPAARLLLERPKVTKIVCASPLLSPLRCGEGKEADI